MNSKYNKWLKGSVLGVLVCFGLAACEDDHFDLKSTTASTTLWENIKANGQLKNFAEILEKVPVTRSEYNRESGLTYAELLNSSQTFTVWAPVDGTYDADAILEQIAAGDAYDVEKEFVRNHMSRFNYPGVTSEVLDILLMNTKKCDFVVDGASSTFKDQQLVSWERTPSKNGTLHLIDGASTYAANMYEALRVLQDGDTLSELSQYILENDTAYFLPESSTPGGTYNGQIYYIDSVFFTGSKLGFGFISYLSNEDSLFLGSYLNNKAWDEAIEKVSPYYQYKSSYPFWEGTSVQTRYEGLNADSMADTRTRLVIMNNMFVSLNSQPGFDPANATVETVRNFIAESDSLITMSGEVLPREAYENVYATAGEITEASNGFYYVLDNYNFVPNQTWQLPITVEGENTYYSLDELNSSYGSVTSVPVTTLNRNDTIPGSVSQDYIARFTPRSSSANTQVTFKLRNLLSGNYKISVVMAPENLVPLYAERPESPRPTRFRATLTNDYMANGSDITVDAKDPEGNQYFVNDLSKMDTITLFENVNIPYAYAGLSNAYLKLQLTVSIPSGAQQRNRYTRYMYIDCILIEGLGRDDENAGV